MFTIFACFTFIPIRREKTLETCLSCIIHHVAHQDSVQFSHCHEVTRWRLSNLSALKGKLLYIQRGIFPINVLTVPLWVMLTLSLLQLPKRDFFLHESCQKPTEGFVGKPKNLFWTVLAVSWESPKNRGDWEPVGGGTGRTDQSQCAEEMRVCTTFSRSLKGRWLEFCNSSRF